MVLSAQIVALARYMARTEVHTYAFSVAANVILSLFPFIVLLLTLSRNVFHSHSMEEVVGDMMKNLLPVGQEFVMRNMQLLAHPHKGTQIFSLVMLLITSTGVIFAAGGSAEPRLGRPAKSQLSSQPGRIAGAGVCGRRPRDDVGCIPPPASRRSSRCYSSATPKTSSSTSSRYGFLKLSAGLAGMLLFFLIYWVLPYQKSSSTRSPSYRHRGRPSVAGGEGPLYQGATVAGLPVRVRSVLYFGRVDDVGISLRTASAGWGALLSDAVHLEACSSGRTGGGRRCKIR